MDILDKIKKNIIQVVKTTSFMKGLYSAEELDGAYLKTSKENKILFLNKLCIIVGKFLILFF